MKHGNKQPSRASVAARRAAVWIGVCAGFAFSSLPVSAADFSSWAYQMQIVVTGYTRPEPLSRFPLLVTFTNRPGFAYSQVLSGTNADLRFADATMTNELSYEVEQWDTNGISLVWVQVPQLTGTNTTIWAYWGKTRQSVPAYATNGATWEPAFRGVWHLDEAVTDEVATGIHLDSTANHFNGAQDGNHQVNGVTGQAQDFDGNDKITLGAVMTMNAYSKEAWVKVTGCGNLISSGNTHAFWVPGGNLQSGHNGDWGGVTDPAAFPMGSWQHVAVTYDSTVNGGQLALYRNGVQVAVATGKAPPGPDEIAYFGSHGGANWFTGQIDEARVSSVARSSNWIWACWMNQASNALFLTTTVGIPSLQNTLPTGVTATSATLNAALASNRMSSVYVTVYWGTNDAGTEARDWQYASTLNGTQPAGTLSKTVTGLLPNHAYFYTCCASNTAGVAWTQPSRAFETWGPPSVNNDGGAIVIDDTTAVPRGTLLEGHAAQATIYWGSSPAALTNASSAGLVEKGVFSVTLNGLNKDDTYYYRCFVSNAYGVASADSVTSFSAILSQILRLEQNAQFGKAVTLGTTALGRGYDAATLATLRAVVDRLKEEKKTALNLAFAIDELETHRDIAERELAKEPEVGVLLLRQAVRERNAAILMNAAAILTSMSDPETPAVLINRLRTCKDREVAAALIDDLERLKDLIQPALVPDVVEAFGQTDAGESPQAQSILATLAGKDIGTNAAASLTAYMARLASRTNTVARPAEAAKP